MRLTFLLRKDYLIELSQSRIVFRTFWKCEKKLFPIFHQTKSKIDLKRKMLFKALMRPVANAVCKVPARNSSAVGGAKSRHVSNIVSIISSAKNNHSIVSNELIFWDSSTGNQMFPLNFILSESR